MLPKIGLGLIIVGSIVAALGSVLDKAAIDFAVFTPGFILSVIGVVMVQVGQRQDAKDETKIASNMAAVETSLASIAANVAGLDDKKDDMDVYDIPQAIDETFLDDIATFVDARESIAHAYGTQQYADIMSHFAAAERYLNRVWSTAADGYIDEAHAFLGHSRAQFQEALDKLSALKAKAA